MTGATFNDILKDKETEHLFYTFILSYIVK